MKLQHVIILFLSILFITACSDQEAAKKLNYEKAPINVQFNISQKQSATGLMFFGTTNLPDKTKLYFYFENDLGGHVDGGIYATVKDGKVNIGPSDKEIPNSPGNYVLGVESLYSKKQPKQVRRIIGIKGENLKGNLIKKTIQGHYLTYELAFSIGNPQNIRKISNLQLKKLKELEDVISLIQKKKRKLEKAYQNRYKINFFDMWLPKWNRQTQQWRNYIENKIDFQSSRLCRAAYASVGMSVVELVLLGGTYTSTDGLTDSFRIANDNITDNIKRSISSIKECIQKIKQGL